MTAGDERFDERGDVAWLRPDVGVDEENVIVFGTELLQRGENIGVFQSARDGLPGDDEIDGRPNGRRLGRAYSLISRIGL